MSAFRSKASVPPGGIAAASDRPTPRTAARAASAIRYLMAVTSSAGVSSVSPPARRQAIAPRLRRGHCSRTESPCGLRLPFEFCVTRKGLQNDERSPVLVLTHDAAAVIRSIVEQADVPEQGGLRITAQPLGDQQAALELAVAEEPDAMDEVVEQEGAHVFLEPVVAQALSDKVLDASVEGDGVRFTIEDQPGGTIQSMNGDGTD